MHVAEMGKQPISGRDIKHLPPRWQEFQMAHTLLQQLLPLPSRPALEAPDCCRLGAGTAVSVCTAKGQHAVIEKGPIWHPCTGVYRQSQCSLVWHLASCSSFANAGVDLSRPAV